jgi:hypothetical protein
MILAISIPQVFFISLFLFSCTNAITPGNFRRAINKYEDIIKTPSTVFIGDSNKITWNLTTTKTISLDLLSSDYQKTVAHIAVDIENVEKFYWTPDSSLKEGVYAIRMFEGRESVSATEVFNLSKRTTSANSTAATSSAKGESTGAASATAAAESSGALATPGSSGKSQVKSGWHELSSAALGGAVGGALAGGIIIGMLVMVFVIGRRRQPTSTPNVPLDGLPLKPYDNLAEIAGEGCRKVELVPFQHRAELDTHYRPEMHAVDERYTNSMSSRDTRV